MSIRAIVMGDLNETLTSHDRYPWRPPSAPVASTITPIQRLISDGYIDTYRLLHPSHTTQPGFTHYSDSITRCTRSRIDYIWTRGLLPSAHRAIHIDHALQAISHHRLLWLELSVDGAGHQRTHPLNYHPCVYQTYVPQPTLINSSLFNIFFFFFN